MRYKTVQLLRARPLSKLKSVLLLVKVFLNMTFDDLNRKEQVPNDIDCA